MKKLFDDEVINTDDVPVVSDDEAPEVVRRGDGYFSNED